MDILISSNLERLLYLLSGSDEEVRGYMQALAETGRYTVSERVFRAVQTEFACGFCTDAQGAQTIGKTFREKNYLLDTHTAVALLFTLFSVYMLIFARTEQSKTFQIGRAHV